MTRASDVDPSFVEAKRKAGVGWASIARMAGCAEADLRKRVDPAALAALRGRFAGWHAGLAHIALGRHRGGSQL